MISTAVSIIIFNFIDPDSAIALKELIVEKTISFMEGMGAPAEAIAEGVDKIESQNTFGFGTQLKSLAQSLVFFAVIGLIVAAIMKKIIQTLNNFLYFWYKI